MPTLKWQKLQIGGDMLKKKLSKVVKAFNVKVVIYGEFERYKLFDQPVNIPNNRGKAGIRGQAKDRDKSIKESVHRAKEKIYGYIMANNWQYWATQTFNGEVIDRYNLDEIIRRYNQKLKDLKRRKFNDLQWLIVPELHKDGAWHLHMLIDGIPEDRVIDSGFTYYNKEKGICRKVYNWVDTVQYGFNDYVHIGGIDALEKLKIANYISKYITKDLAEKRFNKKMYWVSRGLKLPTVTNTLTNNINNIIPQNALILSQKVYYMENKDTGEYYGKVLDIFAYNPYAF